MSFLMKPRPLQPFEMVLVTIEKLGEGGISVKVHSESTKKLLLDRAFIIEGGLERVSIIVTKEGLTLEMS